MGRTSIGLRIENLIIDKRRPPILLYGQRRMGKTSLLKNLGRLLPSNIVPLFVDLQGAAIVQTHSSLLYNIANQVRNSALKQRGVKLPDLPREQLERDPFSYFNEWLETVEQKLDPQTALLTFDEFEALDKRLSDGRFDEADVLGMLRNLIQHRPSFKVMIAGSHTLEEFQRWASYLINVQVIPISYLQEEEARQLIERPIKEFTLRYEPDAVQRVLDITRCHPCLVQLLCSEIVYLKNEQDTAISLATVADVEAAIPNALQSGSFFFADIQQTQITATGVRILQFMAQQGEQAVIRRKTLESKFLGKLEVALEVLLRRELIESVDNGYRFQVELIRCWFAGKL